MNTKINFTQTAIEKLPTPAQGKRFYYHDSKVFGLELMITATGSKSFKVYRKVGGKPIRVTLGKFPTLSVENARKKAIKINNKLNDGINPNEEKKKIRDEHTLKELIDKYIDEYAKFHNKSWESELKTFDRHLSHWYKRRISLITKDEMQKLHLSLGKEKGIYCANRLLSRINTLFNKASKWGWEGNNPAKGITMFKIKSRDRFIQPDELPRFLDALEEETNKIAKDYIYISLLTGARKSNVLSMKWADINFSTNEWRIPETKNGESLTVPLVDQAVRILKIRATANNKLKKPSQYVFEGAGKVGHFTDPKKAWKRILAKADIENLRLHDLRRSLGSYQAILGANSYTIGKSLGHKSQAATAIYARMNLDPVRASMEAATKMMMGIKNG